MGDNCVHTAIDDHSRLAYSEMLPNETAVITAAWWQRAIAWFAARGVVIERVLTYNDPNYRSQLWRGVCNQHAITPKRTRPYRPQTNGQVERFHRTMLVELAYARVYSSDRAPRPCRNRSTSTTITAPTPRSVDNLPRAASPTCQVRNTWSAPPVASLHTS